MRILSDIISVCIISIGFYLIILACGKTVENWGLWLLGSAMIGFGYLFGILGSIMLKKHNETSAK